MRELCIHTSCTVHTLVVHLPSANLYSAHRRRGLYLAALETRMPAHPTLRLDSLRVSPHSVSRIMRIRSPSRGGARAAARCACPRHRAPPYTCTRSGRPGARLSVPLPRTHTAPHQREGAREREGVREREGARETVHHSDGDRLDLGGPLVVDGEPADALFQLVGHLARVRVGLRPERLLRAKLKGGVTTVAHATDFEAITSD